MIKWEVHCRTGAWGVALIQEFSTPLRGMGAWRYSSTNLGIGWRWAVSFMPHPLCPKEKPQYPFDRRLGGPQSQRGHQSRHFLALPRIEPGPCSLKSSLYWAIPVPTVAFYCTKVHYFTPQRWDYINSNYYYYWCEGEQYIIIIIILCKLSHLITASKR
jgi:hypothetical protein